MIVTMKLGHHPRTGAALFNAWVTTPPKGDTIIGTGATENQAQTRAAQFLASNYPNESVTWEGGYRGEIREIAQRRPRRSPWMP